MTIEDGDSALQIVEAGRVRVLARLRDAVEEQLQARPDLVEVDPATIDQLVEEAFGRAGPSLWRISLAEGAHDEYGIDVHEALSHPSVAAAEQLIGVESADDEHDPWPTWAESTPEEPEPAPTPAEPEPEPVAVEPEPVVAEPAPEPVIYDPEPVVPDPQPAAPAPTTVPAGPQPLRMAVVHASGIESLKSGDKDIELVLSDAGLDVLKRSSGAALGRLDWTMITGIDVAPPKRGRRRKRKPQLLQVSTGGGVAVFELVELSPEEIDAQLRPMLAELRDAGLPA